MRTESSYVAIIKGRGFCPNPVARFGIPEFSNTILNPKVEGTSAWEQWWLEQIDHCRNGYKTGGLTIPGRYYYYLNYELLSTIGRGIHYPDYVDLDYEFFDTIDQIKKAQQGMICVKKRRGGVSHKWAQGVVGYEMRFNPNTYCAGVVSGMDIYSQGLFDKFKTSESQKPPELRLNTLLNNTEVWQAGYKVNVDGQWIDQGSMNRFLCRTVHAKPNVFKGEMLNDCGFEEGGETKLLMDCFNATEKCFAVGNKMVGTPYVWGTGGNIKSESAGFRDMWYDADTYNLVRFELMGPRMAVSFFMGSVNEKGEIEENCPNIKKMMKEVRAEDGTLIREALRKEQVLGCEDIEAKTKDIGETRARLAKGKNKKKYYEELRDNPLNVKEAFLEFSANDFDSELLSMQMHECQILTNPKYGKYKLEWERTEDGTIKQPRKVTCTLARELDAEEDCVLIRHGYFPRPDYRNLYLGAGDSYDLDTSATTKSLGAFVIGIRDHNIKDLDTMCPALLINTRPKRKEIFYDNCLKASVFYDLVGATLFDLGKPMIIQWYKDQGCEKYLAKRPLSVESEHSEQQHTYGFAITVASKPKMISMMQTNIVDHGHKNWFPNILADLINYNVASKNSDWDCADAWGIFLVLHYDLIKFRPQTTGEEKGDGAYDFPKYVLDEDDNIRVINVRNVPSDIKDPFLRMIASGQLGGTDD